MQTIGKIINGKYVRYGAVSVGDKLGDAAFANIVNNATTTEEGFVPDARVVAQQQQIITQQQEQIDSLNSAMESVNRVQTALTMSPAYLNTVDLINNYHNSYSNNLPDNTWYRYMANQRAAGGMLGGGYWYIEGVKSTKDWEWQMARSYLMLANGGLRYRTKQAGVWQPWEMVQ